MAFRIMFLNKIYRLSTNSDVGSRASTRFLRRFVSTEAKDVSIDPDKLKDFEQRRESRLRLQARSVLINTPKIGDLLQKVLDPNNPGVARIVDMFTKWYGRPPILEDPRDGWDQGATGIRAFNAIKVLLAKHDKSVGDLTFAIQGFENVGSWIALLVHEAGGKVVAVSEVTGAAVKNKEGIDITALLEHMDSKGNCLADFSGADSIDADELLASECDVLVPVGRALSRKHAADVKAKFVIKNVNYPTHPAGEEIMSKKGVVILDKSGIAEESSDEELRENYVEKAIDSLIKGWKAKLSVRDNDEDIIRLKNKILSK